MELKVSEIAELVGGKIYGNKDTLISNVAKIEDAQKGDLTFLYMPSYNKFLESTGASAILISPEIEKTRTDIAFIEVEKPNIAFQNIIIKYLQPEFELTGINSTSFIDDTSQLGKNTAVGRNVVIGKNCKIEEGTKIFHNCVIMDNCRIGKNTLIFPNVTLREESIIGNNVIIHSGTVIGSDGFGYSPNAEGVYQKIPQVGNVIVEDNVEIGSNVSIDRAAIGSTIIMNGAKLDNLIQIAHNVQIGRNTVISAQTGVSGSTKIGNNCILAGQVGTVGHIELTDGVIVGAQSGVSKSIKKPGKYFGYPAKEMAQSLRLESHIRNLPNYSERIKSLENKIKELENQISKK